MAGWEDIRDASYAAAMPPAPGDSPTPRRSGRLSIPWALLLTGSLLASACTCGSNVIPASPLERDAPGDGEGPPSRDGEVASRGPRPSSFRPCPEKVPGGCDYGEACDFTEYDLLCPEGPCDGPQTGDLRCHRVCDDGSCGPGETCGQRTVAVSDTGSKQLPLCLCSGKDCPERGPGGIPWPPEGGLALWRPERAMPSDVYYHAATTTQDRLFVSGGMRIEELTGSGASLTPNAKVFSAPLQADGRLGEWRESGMLPVPLHHHGMAVLRGRLFIAGGQRSSDFTNAVISALIQEDGTLGPWREEAPLPEPRAWHSLVASGDALWVVGGSLNSASFTEGAPKVLRAKVSASPEARVSGWEVIEAPAALHYDQGATLANGRLYSVDTRGRLYSFTPGAGQDWRAESQPPWMGWVGFGGSGQHGVRLVALPEMLLVLMPRGLTLTADLRADGSVTNWRPASRLYGPGSGFATALSAEGRVFVLGGTSDTPSPRRNPEVWSTQRLVP
ncbi:hypothetical protein [Myxococcus sp. RHSTA-1-4]|uniref:hypothetical protein n=1 Tax=Myxococcus sp. RHSTA-1-4 TaxID=2874601 RepID=UPI001CBBE596|nr:hypothetical protein [Myxococcus sp. RHSTA-1-4]MBZ4419552.1 hypothetical protein [Myxococcus sp. RHSTA-1-4]